MKVRFVKGVGISDFRVDWRDNFKGRHVFILALNGSSHGGSASKMALATYDAYAPSSCV